jgi:hypothetical protein
MHSYRLLKEVVRIVTACSAWEQYGDSCWFVSQNGCSAARRRGLVALATATHVASQVTVPDDVTVWKLPFSFVVLSKSIPANYFHGQQMALLVHELCHSVRLKSV